MNLVYDQVGVLTRGVNPTADSERVQAAVVGAGSMNFGGSQNHYAWRPLCMLDSTGKLHEKMILNHVQSELYDLENEGVKT